jgi:hypothetical protein
MAAGVVYGQFRLVSDGLNLKYGAAAVVDQAVAVVNNLLKLAVLEHMLEKQLQLFQETHIEFVQQEVQVAALLVVELKVFLVMCKQNLQQIQ